MTTSHSVGKEPQAGPSRVHAEIKQSRPFRSLRQEAVVALLRTADEVRHLYASALGPDRVTLPQYNVLRILRGAGDRGLPTMEIRDRMVERAPGITRLVDRLAKCGWVSRRSSQEDRRQVWVRITAEGRARVDGLDAVVHAVDDRALESLDEDSLGRFVEALDSVRGSLGN